MEVERREDSCRKGKKTRVVGQVVEGLRRSHHNLKTEDRSTNEPHNASR